VSSAPPAATVTSVQQVRHGWWWRLARMPEYLLVLPVYCLRHISQGCSEPGAVCFRGLCIRSYRQFQVLNHHATCTLLGNPVRCSFATQKQPSPSLPVLHPNSSLLVPPRLTLHALTPPHPHSHTPPPLSPPPCACMQRPQLLPSMQLTVAAPTLAPASCARANAPPAAAPSPASIPAVLCARAAARCFLAPVMPAASALLAAAALDVGGFDRCVWQASGGQVWM
jgi:hypothetical protein